METTLAAAVPGVPASCEIAARLPEDILLASFARAGTVAACRATAVCRAFHAAADCDALWAGFLPRDLPPFADVELSPPPASKKDLFMRISNGHVLLADGLTSMCLHRETGAVCYMLSARKLSIASGDNPAHWRWIPVTGSRFTEAAELHNSQCLKICGNIDSKMLSQRTTYTAYIVFKVDDSCYGLHYPCQETSLSIGGRKFTRNVCLGGHDLGLAWLLVMRGDIPDDSKFPKKRADGWLELEMGEFHNGEGEDGEVSISLMEMSVVKSGLVVLGIEIRPKGLLSSMSIVRKSPPPWPAFRAPRHLPSLADGEVSTPLTSKKALFLRLLDGPVFLDDGLTSLWLDRETSGMCYMVSARKLSITGGENSTNFHWIHITGSRFLEAIEIHHCQWLEIHSKIDSKMLSQHTTYTAYIVFKVDKDQCYGLDSPWQEAFISIGGNKLMQNVCLGAHDPAYAFMLVLHDVIPEDTLTPRSRDDGWNELKLGDFHNNEGEDGEVSFSLMETSTVKNGLVILGIEIRSEKKRGAWE